MVINRNFADSFSSAYLNIVFAVAFQTQKTPELDISHSTWYVKAAYYMSLFTLLTSA